MPAFTLEDLRTFLSEKLVEKSLIPAKSINDFLSDFEDIWDSYNSLRQSDSNEVRKLVPENFANKAFEYLFLNAFEHHFLKGVKQTQKITEAFSRTTVKSISLYRENRPVDTFNINHINSIRLSEDIFILKEQFNILREQMLGDYLDNREPIKNS